MSRLPYPDKPKPRGGVPLSTFNLLFFMVVLGVMIGGSAMLASAPTLFNHRATQDYFSTLQAWVGQREASIVATQAAIAHEFNRLENAATQQAINLDATAVALGSDAALLRQTATQLTNFAQATATANAAQTNRQMTQVALDFVATQSQIDQIATQAALNFAATMAAFGTPEAALPAQSLSLAAPPTQPALPFDSSPTPLPFGQPVHTAFSGGIPSHRWLTSGSTDWAQSQRGVVAQQGANAWLLARAPARGRAEITFEPALASPVVYRVLLLGNNGENWYLQIDTEALRATRAALYRFDGGLPVQGVGERLAETALSLPLQGLNLLTLDLFNGFEASLNGSALLRVADRTLPALPQFGVQFPPGALIATVLLN
ncbi:hypothetical protein VZO05_15245 [Aggregatilineales bacterium SYSU G02658]